MTMAPATESVMGALPREKAGVGSAINDTTRQVGGALGVAIIGSVVSSVYGSKIASAATGFGLDAQQTAVAEASLGTAQRLAATLGDQGAAFISAANDGFVDALSIGLRISASVVIVAAIVAWRFLPSHAREATMPGIPLVDPVDVRCSTATVRPRRFVPYADDSRPRPPPTIAACTRPGGRELTDAGRCGAVDGRRHDHFEHNESP